MIQAAKAADIDMAQKMKTMTAEEFRRHVQKFSKYSFYFYRLKKN